MSIGFSVGLCVPRIESCVRHSPLSHRPTSLNVFIARLFFFAVLSSLFTATSQGYKRSLSLSNSRGGVLAHEITPQQTKPSDIHELKLGVPVERELAGGVAHSYIVTLTAGQYMKVVVEQKGIDVVVRLFGPDGQKITEVDSPNGTEGPEPVSVIAEAAGAYLLEVKSLEEKTAPGKYEVKVEELRESTT